MRRDEYEGLHSKMQEIICEEHGIPYIKTMLGTQICPFCEHEEWLNGR